MVHWAGKHQLSFEQYHQVPVIWQVAPLLELHQQLGGWFALASTPRLALRADRPQLSHNHVALWYNLADGIRAGDSICAELAVRFIEAHLIVSYAGYARLRLLRALKNTALDAKQKFRLSRHFLLRLQQQDREPGFHEVLRLWKKIIPPEHLLKVKQLVLTTGQQDDKFTLQLLNAFFQSQTLAQLASN